MSDHEGGETGDGDPLPPRPPESPHDRLVVATSETIRMSQRPPVRYSSGADLELWLKRFELYA